ncbi:MAG: hypothetical protein JRN15_21135 [Nitrososphaerota archaeon]|nr:hypothetical protein [Nitrososphaerota archaeon]
MNRIRTFLVVSLFVLSLAVSSSVIREASGTGVMRSSGVAASNVSPLGRLTYRVGTPDFNGSETNNAGVSLPPNTRAPFVPGVTFKMHGANDNMSKQSRDPQLPCTTSDTTYSFPGACTDGLYYVGAYGWRIPAQSGSYSDAISLVEENVSFSGTTVSDLGSGDWISGGMTMLSPAKCLTCNAGYTTPGDIGFEFFAYLDSSGNVGVAWYVIGACEWPPYCAGDIGTYQILASNSAEITGAKSTDTVLVEVYWCVTTSCTSINNGQGVYVFDETDPAVSSNTYTVYDFKPPNYELNTQDTPPTYWDFGVDISCPAPSPGGACNPPYNESYAFQVGFSSNAKINNPNWLVEISNPNWIATNGTASHVVHGSIIGVQQEMNFQATGDYYAAGDAWWHENWVWGQQWSSSPISFSQLTTAVSITPIDDLQSSQANSQIFTAIGSRTVCVEVTNFASLKSDADGASEGSQQLGSWIAGHSAYDGTWWTVRSQSSCAYITWTYANGYSPSDNNQVW